MQSILRVMVAGWLLFGLQASLADDSVVVRGRVVYRITGEPIVDANVNGQDMCKGISLGAKRFEGGRFELKLWPGNWNVVVVEGDSHEAAKVPYPVEVLAEQAEEATDVDLGDIQVTAKQMVSVAVMRPDGSPAVGVIVIPPHGSRTSAFVTDDQGTFRCWPPKNTSPMTSCYAFVMNQPLVGMAKLSDDDAEQLTIPLALEAWWTGNVTDRETRQPIEGVQVR